ncbi:hypothetical protein PSU4_01010 [Pseudonocardia sulfidoxydans NBRC 16205]|uniref:Integrase catalytic domain-containing protein n=1 Tax=Pseudonocardia sulfidoxydans NBRC 16205 TaxID=1223511 RepID=A0A511D966_9PSEU|nr:hypothetical protein PSU4_01010 [Pseudonocardia sulfidoxydans NBRC 16205]
MPDDAPRGAVSTFCTEHAISRRSFYELRKPARDEGPAAVLEPRSRRLRSSPSKLTEQVKAQAVAVRAALEASGLDHGPISVHDKMRAMGLSPVPSTASLARIFREAGVARREPRKKPRSAWRRFVYPAPNACWQLDATEYVLTGGRKCVIFQLIDDHPRYALASHAAAGETAQDAIAVSDQGRDRPRRPTTAADRQRARAQPNPSRRGLVGRLVGHVAALGVEAITGKPDKLPPDPVPLPRQATLGGHTPSLQARSTRSTTSTTPGAPTKGRPGGSHRWPRGRRPRKPIHHARNPTGPSTGRRPPPWCPGRARPQAYPPAHTHER